MNVAEMIDAELGRIHPCTCGPEYTKRHDRAGRPLVDPFCVHHQMVGDGERIVAVLRLYGHLDPTEQHRFT